MQLIDLPTDILVLLFPYLDANDFLALTSSCAPFLAYRHDPTYWRSLTRSTFRIPPQPLLEADGAHWQRLYKNLKTQTHVYTWGSNSRGNLGHYQPPRHPQRRPTRIRGIQGWPQEMVNVGQVGIVADVQCGGWSTILLNSTGQLWAVGVLNGMVELRGDYPTLHQLSFPSAYPAASSSRYEPSTAVKQFSVGRYRLLALSDDNKIWSWSSFKHPAQMIKFFTLDNDATRSQNGEGLVTKVVAGWSKASAYIQGSGIVYWSAQPDYDPHSHTDAFIVQHFTVPGTAFRRSHPNRVLRESPDIDIGEVVEYVYLDRYIVFVTHNRKLFAWSTDGAEQSYNTPVELSQFYGKSDPCIKSVQGSFIKFGVFTTDGAVLIGTKDFLDMAWAEHCDNRTSSTPPAELLPTAPPALQSSSVISLAFGDYHFHALHSNGTLTSYGTESQACGSLGLGDHSISHLRGVYYARRNTGDGRLQIPSWSDGRRTIWFEEEKQQWLFDTCQKGATNEASPRRLRSVEDPATVSLMGEYFECGGRNWSKGPAGDQHEPEDDEIDAYFALKVAAAGHSSAALVLVNQEKAARVRMKYVKEQPLLSVKDPGDLERDAGHSSPQTLAESARQYLVDFGRWALGLTERDERQRTEERQEMSPEEVKRARAEEIRYKSVYVWEQQPFPRLRYPDGTVMPGEVDVTEWKGGEPKFDTAPEFVD